MHPAAAALAARIAAALRAYAPGGVVAAYLFGAHAAGRAHRDSDVDVGVLLERGSGSGARERFQRGVQLGSWLVAELREPLVDLVVLNDAPPEVAAHIVAAGTRVFCSDANAEVEFRRDAQLRAADLAPWLRRMRAAKLEALAQ